MVNIEGPVLTAGEGGIATVSVSALGTGPDSAPEAGWRYEVWADDTTVSANDIGVWPDVAAGDGVAAMYLPPFSPGVHALTVNAVKDQGADAGRVSLSTAPFVSVPVSALSIQQGIAVSQSLDELGLVESFDVQVPITNNTATTQTVGVQVIVESAAGVTATNTVETSIPPSASQNAEVPFVASELAEAMGDATIHVAHVYVMHNYLEPDEDPGDEGWLPPDDSLGSEGQDAVLAEAEPSGLEFQVSMNAVSQKEVVATDVSAPSAAPWNVRVEGVATWRGATIEGVDYSVDGGGRWYGASAMDGSWGSAVESFTVEFELPAEGDYEIQIRPRSASGRWDSGDDVGVTAGIDQ